MNENETESIIEESKDAVNEEIITEEIKPEAEAEVKKSRSKLSIAIEIGIYVALVFICLFIIPKYVMQRTAVSGQSMEDTLHNK